MNSVETMLGAAAIVGALGLAAGAWQYAANVPASQIFGRTWIDQPETNSARPTVYLTFDDGPSALNTPALLDILGAAGAVGTFFLVGNHVRRHPALARRVVDEGHTVGNHTDMHPNLSRKPAARVRAELEACQQAIFDVTGAVPKLFRPPYGARRPAVLRIARDLALTPVMWNITAGDWASPGFEPLLARVERGIQRNQRQGRTSNLLLHDASQLDGDKPESRADTLRVVDSLVRRSNLRFPGITV
jgi:peptidoglycan/xylan/chitin deacetylase (PgdA/CDA1 family)